MFAFAAVVFAAEHLGMGASNGVRRGVLVGLVTLAVPLSLLRPCCDPKLMELEAGENPKSENQEIQLIVTPGLRKRGKSTGDEFKTENTLLLMQVSCEPVFFGGRSR